MMKQLSNSMWKILFLSSVCILFSCNQAPKLNAPADLKITDISASHFTLEWQDVAEGEMGYKIERQLSNGEWLWIGTVPANVTTFESGGLDGQTSYIHRVYAYSDSIKGPYSDKVQARTDVWPDSQRGKVIEATTIRSDAPTFYRARNGDLVMIFASFTGMRDKDRARIAVKRSTDNGDTWTHMELLFDQGKVHICYHKVDLVDIKKRPWEKIELAYLRLDKGWFLD